MFTLRTLFVASAALVLALGLWACDDQTLPGAAAPAEPPESASGGTATEAGSVAEVRIGSDDQMRFDTPEFRVRSGQTIRLTLVHEGQLPVEAMGHNLVILGSGADPVAFGDEALRRGAGAANEWLPEPMRDRVIAFTRMLGGGERDTIEFEAGEPGRYPYLCSFPGHYAMMRGVMIVE